MPPSSLYPGPHPDPSSELPTRTLPISIDQRVWYRLHRAEHAALFFGRTGHNRFDAPDGEYGMLYLGDSLQCCFVETYGRTDRNAHRIVTRHELAGRSLSSVAFRRPLRVVDLTGYGLARTGADNRLATGDYLVAQRWSRALWPHPDQPDGLLYRSRHDPSRLCLALYDRIADHVIATNLGSFLDASHLALLVEILDTYDIGYLE